MKKGDLAFFYHSNCKTPGIAGVMQIVQEASVDGKYKLLLFFFNGTSTLQFLIGGDSESAFDEKSPYYDGKSSRDNPRWFNVHVGYEKTFPSFVSLRELQSYSKAGDVLAEMQLLKQSRLSVSKVTNGEWNFIMRLGQRPTAEVDTIPEKGTKSKRKSSPKCY